MKLYKQKFDKLKIIFYNPVILTIIKYKTVKQIRITIGIKKRNFFIFNKFLKGARITNINPAKLLIKKRG